MSARSFFLFFLFFICFAGYAQNQVHEVLGKVIDTEGFPIEFATVKLLKAEDSTLINAMYADELGQFKFTSIPCNETCILKLSNVGYKTKYLLENKSVSCLSYDYGTIQLSIDRALNLEEVKVQAQVDVLKAGIDKKIYNVGQDISVRGGTANDVLNRLP